MLREETEDAEKQFIYDRQGGIIEETNQTGIRRFAYDSRHRQIIVKTENGSVQENRYDVDNLGFELLENAPALYTMMAGFCMRKGEKTTGRQAIIWEQG